MHKQYPWKQPLRLPRPLSWKLLRMSVHAPDIMSFHETCGAEVLAVSPTMSICAIRSIRAVAPADMCSKSTNAIHAHNACSIQGRDKHIGNTASPCIAFTGLTQSAQHVKLGANATAVGNALLATCKQSMSDLHLSGDSARCDLPGGWWLPWWLVCVRMP